MREWKPGDVAHIKGSGMDTVAIWSGRFWVWVDGHGPFDGVSHCRPDIEGEGATIRPLIVIDPEDREQVERLWIALRDGLSLRSRDNLVGALRSLVTPPKPEEPTGLGAVVEDASGDVWLRWSSGTGCVWRCPNSDFKAAAYTAIAAVKVLSEGVTA